TAKNTVTSTQQQLSAAQERLMTARTATQQALLAYQAGKVTVDQVEQQSAAALKVSELGGKLSAATALRKKITSAQTELAAAEQVLKTMESELPSQQAAQQAAAEAVQTATARLTDLQ